MMWSGLVLCLLAATGRPSGVSEPIRLNQIQVIGTHNSYHLAPTPEVLTYIKGLVGDAVDGWDYSHKPLAEQFERLKIRQIELDVLADPEGGRFARPKIRGMLSALGRNPGPDPNENGVLEKPGLKVLHVQDIDYRSTVPTLRAALEEIRAWSTAHPRHVPILVLLELKEERRAGLTPPAPFDRDQLDGVDREILDVFDRERILAPDDVRGEFETLPEAIQQRGWPALDAVRGKVMFGLDNEGELRDRYLEGHPALRGRLLFVSVGPEHPAAAWMKVNDAVGDFERIQDLVRRGFLVRTRADADTRQARANDPTTRDKAMASGAQFVSTDYPEPDERFSAYQVELGGGIAARSNPVCGPRILDGKDLESVAEAPSP